MMKDYTKLTNLAECQVHAKIQNDKLQLRIVPNQGFKTWEAQISDLATCSEMMSKLFEGLPDLLDHLQDSNSLKINFDEQTLQILLKTTIKNKQIYTEIGKLKLIPIKGIDLQNIQFSDISNVCKSEVNLSSLHIKKILGVIADKVQTLTGDYKIDEALDPIINKFKIVGNQTQNLQNKIGGLHQQIDVMRKINEISGADILQQIQSLKKQIKENNTKFQETLIKQIIASQTKFVELCNDLEDRIQKFNTNKETEWLQIQKMRRQFESFQTGVYKFMQGSSLKLQKVESGVKPPNLIATLIDTTSPFISHFKIEGRIISKIKTTPGYFTMLVGKRSIGQRRSFSVKIKNSQTRPVMMFGILESAHKKQQYCEKTDNRVWLSTQSVIFDGEDERNTGKTFGFKDIISVDVDVKATKVTWKNGGNAFSAVCQKIKDPFTIWYPCVWMAEIGDTIQWINE